MNQSLLYLPTEQALIIPANIHKDMSDEEFEAEMDEMMTRSELSKSVLQDGVGLEDLLDCIATQNIHTDSYLDSLEQCLSIF